MAVGMHTHRLLKAGWLALPVPAGSPELAVGIINYMDSFTTPCTLGAELSKQHEIPQRRRQCNTEHSGDRRWHLPARW